MNFDYEKFSQMVKEEAPVYQSKHPYPFALFDGLFSNQLLDDVNFEIDKSNFKKDVREISDIEVKARSDFNDNECVSESFKKVFDVLNGGKFLEIVSTLTGIMGLISDPYFDGGGVNIIKNDGTLAVHIDGTTQRRMNISRRLNAIVFLNDYWDESWNGYHEQWQMKNTNLAPDDFGQQWKCVRKILPKKNRLLIFTTNDHSWHGHAGVLKVPNKVERRSIITYYYTNGRPKSDIIYEEPHSAIFINNKQTLSPEAFSETELIL